MTSVAVAEVLDFEEDTAVWISSPSAVWLPGKVVKCTASELFVKVEGPEAQELRVPRSGTAAVLAKSGAAGAGPRLLRRDASLDGAGALNFDDLTEVPELHEAAVLEALDVRFVHGQIYTLSGPVLLAVNPFRTLHGLYSPETLHGFFSDEIPLRPHIFSVANQAFQGILRHGTSQTVLVSGESGSGKTETTKFVMQFLALAGAEAVVSQTSRPLSRVERQVLRSNPLLESFGNAKTLRNDNSSRFGKYIELQFGRPSGGDASAAPRLVGAFTHTYLLEKVRVVGQQKGERNFHIFYQALAAAARERDGSAGAATADSVELRGVLGFRAEDFAFLAGSRCYELAPGVDEAKDFDTTLVALKSFGVEGKNASALLGAVMAVLHLGNLQFTAPPTNSEGAELAAAQGDVVSRCCELLEVDASELATALCRKTMQAPGESVISMPVTVVKAAESRDALARHLYGAVFAFVVERVNDTISSARGRANGDALPFVGVLDIFGFEFFTRNSLEQLFINFTNELLQQYFNEVIFENETMLYAREGVKWDPRDFPDNATIVELISASKTGVLPMLDDECAIVGGSSEQWCSKLLKAHVKNKNFDVIKYRPGNFIIGHFAGRVEYESQAFLEKNRDVLGADIVRCLKESRGAFVRSLFAEHDRIFGTQESLDSRMVPRRSRAKKYTVASEFQGQLRNLMDRIRSTEPHFVRCIKPNPKNAPAVFDRRSVVEQLRYQGVLQAVEVSRSGFPMRLRHRQGVLRFRCLATGDTRRRLEAEIARCDFASAAQILFKGFVDDPNARLVEDTWAVGSTLIFLKQAAVEVLSTALFARRRSAARSVQSIWRCVLQRGRFVMIRQAVLRLQAYGRGLMARRLSAALRRHRCAVRLQCAARGRSARRRRCHLMFALGRLQRAIRAWRARRQLARCLGSTVRIQRWRRRTVRRLKEKRRWSCALLVQRAWRGHTGRKVCKLRMAAQQRRRRAGSRLLHSWRTRVCDRVIHRHENRDVMGGEGKLDRVSFGYVGERQALAEANTSGELLAAAAALRSRLALLNEETEALRHRRNKWQDEAFEIRRWTAMGMLRRIATKIFGDNCAEDADAPPLVEAGGGGGEELEAHGRCSAAEASARLSSAAAAAAAASSATASAAAAASEEAARKSQGRGT
mmetsp:Transcript_174927/g.555363  ORF Transcript_174927/g.555363 Transcript_174927/m.555363 type:complete len:1153 (+) Transcript_174927:130-3588(+)